MLCVVLLAVGMQASLCVLLAIAGKYLSLLFVHHGSRHVDRMSAEDTFDNLSSPQMPDRRRGRRKLFRYCRQIVEKTRIVSVNGGHSMPRTDIGTVARSQEQV